MTTPLHQVKAELFKTVGHPARVRVLELLSEGERSVSEMLPEVGIEPAHLSQQLAVLRRAGLVVARREGASVYYRLTHARIANLLAVAREILTEVLTEQVGLLADLRADESATAASPESARLASPEPTIPTLPASASSESPVRQPEDVAVPGRHNA